MTLSKPVTWLLPSVLVSLFLPSSHPAAEAAEGAQRPGVLVSEFIYEQVPFPQCHASTIAETHAGLVAAWFGGTRESAADVGVWCWKRQRVKHIVLDPAKLVLREMQAGVWPNP